MYKHDQRTVMTLDAGGTNFVFSAICGNQDIVTPICYPAVSDNLEECLTVLHRGFSQVKEQLEDEPVAISFAFPGPADYKNGIIGDLPNFPAFRGGVALGPFLKEKFGIPVYSTPEVHAGINKSYCMTEKLSTCVHYLHKGETMELEDFAITAFEVPHDGTDNVGYCMNIDGKIFSFLTDLGHITPTAAEYICKANYLVLEANYDEEMLKMGPYPQYLKERIAGPNGHMSNRETADFLAENINESLKYIWLCHLSKDNNHPELAYKTVELSLRNKGIIVGKDVQVIALKRNTPSDVYEFE